MSFKEAAGLNADHRPLYNGNISSMSIYNKRLGDVGAPGGALLLYNYRYDQLNRLKGMDVFKNFNYANNDWNTLLADTMMKERVTYDPNGNILSYKRNHATGPIMDDLQYNYYPGTNRLRQVTDAVGDGVFPGADIIYDIDNQGINNYVYDEIGNLISDAKEQIDTIKWNVYGKITEIKRSSSGSVPVTNIKYFYDALGNRIGKVFDLGGNKRYTWYVRDAQGNVLSIYNDDNGGTLALDALTVQQAEQYLYGSSRLGMIANGQEVDNSNAGPGSMQYFSGGLYLRGKRNYELTNHLGNVLAVVTDKKIGVSSGGSLNDYYNADIVSATDYYPFGMADVLKKDQIFRKIYKDLDDDYDNFIVSEFSESVRKRYPTARGVFIPDAFSTFFTKDNHKIQFNDNEERRNGFRPGVIYEEFFHAAQEEFGNSSSFTMKEVEAKVAVAFAVYRSLKETDRNDPEKVSLALGEFAANATILINDKTEYITAHETKLVKVFKEDVKKYFDALINNTKITPDAEKSFRKSLKLFGNRLREDLYGSTIVDTDDYEGETPYFDKLVKNKE